MLQSTESLVQFLSEPVVNGSSSSFPLRVALDSGIETTMDCPLNLLCALVILRGGNADHMDLLATRPVPIELVQQAMSIVRTVHPPERGTGLIIDFEKLARDAKYAAQVQMQIAQVREVGELIRSFSGKVFTLAVSSIGCRVIQGLLDVVAQHGTVDDIITVIRPELTGRAVDVALDVNGNHVIQKCIDVLPPRACLPLVHGMTGGTTMASTVRKMASHCYGCRVIQRLISKCSSEPGFAQAVLEPLCGDPKFIQILTEDVFGNYVMQHVIQFGRPIDRERVSLCLASNVNVIRLGCSKYASNVVEKAIRHGEIVATKLLINSIIMAEDRVSNEPGIITLMKDRYGNYVVRAIMEQSSSELEEEVALVKKLIAINAHVLKKFTFSWHLVERLDKMASIIG